MAHITRWQFIAELTALLERQFHGGQDIYDLSADDIDDVQAALDKYCEALVTTLKAAGVDDLVAGDGDTLMKSRREALDVLIVAGTRLSNVAYYLATRQGDQLDAFMCETLKTTYAAWDQALADYRYWHPSQSRRKPRAHR